jgi:hypothetical protein
MMLKDTSEEMGLDPETKPLADALGDWVCWSQVNGKAATLLALVTARL